MSHTFARKSSTVAPSDPSRRQSVRSIGRLAVGAVALHSVALAASARVVPPDIIFPANSLLPGYGFGHLASTLLGALMGSEVRSSQDHLKDRMAAFDLQIQGNAPPLVLFLGQSRARADLVSRLYWPEWGYHDAKIKEGAPYSHPVSPREGLAFSDKQIFEEALGRRATALMRTPQAYARDYRDSRGNDLRIVAARLPAGEIYVAESDGRNATAYEINAHSG